MPCIRGCWNNMCIYNRSGCYCDADEVEIDEYGTCLVMDESKEEATDEVVD